MRRTIIVAGVAIAAQACAGGCDRQSPKDVKTEAMSAVVAEPIEEVEGKSIESNDRAYRVVYSTAPSPIVVNEPFAIEVRIETLDGSGIDGMTLEVDAAMPEHGHGMNVEPKVVSLGSGRFGVEGMVFHMLGRWELYFDIMREGITSRAQDEIVLE